MANTVLTDTDLIRCHPSSRQLRTEQLAFYAFVHFTVNTFTDQEWGTGKESPSVFSPTQADPRQWAGAVRSAGMKGLILTCKHHDGFCLWPSRFTEHSIKNSPYQNGMGDLVRETADACAEAGLTFGVYLSPWDRNSPLYGQGKPYDDYFCSQLTELCTNYGELFTVWFDGACGEGPNGKLQKYDWPRYYALIRRLQPKACISVSGPDIRWCGNEAGQTRESEWSVLPEAFLSPDRTAENSQKSDDPAFRCRHLSPQDADLGSRDLLKNASGLCWYPAETDVSIRPGWFYHSSEDSLVKSADTLLDIWYRSVGGNSTLLLNIPPDRRGLFHENDVRTLESLGNTLKKTFAVNLAADAVITADRTDGCHLPENLKQDCYDEFYKAPDGVSAAVITVSLSGPKTISHVVIKEYIPLSQRIESHILEIRLKDGSFQKIARGTTVGYLKIHRFAPVETDMLRLRITDSRVCPVLSFLGIY